MLDVPRDALDVHRWEADLARARHLADTGNTSAARDVLSGGLIRWRGNAYADITANDVDSERTRLTSGRLAGLELLAEFDIALGNPEAAIDQLHRLLREAPLRETAHRALMIAQCRAGRPADALLHYEAVRTLLADELGTDPGPDLRAQHASILQHHYPPAVLATGPVTTQVRSPRPHPERVLPPLRRPVASRRRRRQARRLVARRPAA